MKYWLLTTEYPPFYGGGISTYCYHTAKMLVSQGYEVTVFVNDAAVSDYTTEVLDMIRVVRFNPSRTNSRLSLGYNTQLSYEYAEIVKTFIIKESAPAIIESQEYLGIAYYLLQFKHALYDWCREIPVLITAHSPAFLYWEFNHVSLYRYPNYWIGEMERFCMQAADELIVPSRYLLQEISSRFALTNKNVSLVPNPFRIPESSVPRRSVGKGQIIFYGKLSAQKGTFRLLEYFEELWNEGFNETLYLVGGNDIIYHTAGKSMGHIIRSKYNKYIDKGLLVIEGQVKPSEIEDRLGKAKLVVVPSTVDNLPYVVFEMMALGKIVLVSKQGGQAEIVDHGLNGFIFDHEICGDFKRQLKYILSLSDEETQRIAVKAIQTILQGYDFHVIFPRKKISIDCCLQTAQEKQTRYPFLRPGDINANEVKPEEHNSLLSVIIPYYNLGLYIEETMASLSAADYSPMEIILVNDGSTDAASVAKLDQYRDKNGIRVYDTDNKGLANARNYGASQASGKFLAFLDADDTIDPQYYRKGITVLQRYSNVHFIGAWTKYFDGSLNIWPTFNPEPPLILYHNTINSSALIYKRAAFLDGGINDVNMPFKGLEDYQSVITLIAKGYNGIALPEMLFNYRVRPDSMIRSISIAKKLLLYEYIAYQNKKFYANFAAELFSLSTANGPGIYLDNPTPDYHLADRLSLSGKFSLKMISLIKRNKMVRRIAYKLYRFIKQ